MATRRQIKNQFLYYKLFCSIRRNAILSYLPYFNSKAQWALLTVLGIHGFLSGEQIGTSAQHQASLLCGTPESSEVKYFPISDFKNLPMVPVLVRRYCLVTERIE